MQSLEECYRLIGESMFANIPRSGKRPGSTPRCEDNWGRHTG